MVKHLIFGNSHFWEFWGILIFGNFWEFPFLGILRNKPGSGGYVQAMDRMHDALGRGAAYKELEEKIRPAERGAVSRVGLSPNVGTERGNAQPYGKFGRAVVFRPDQTRVVTNEGERSDTRMTTGTSAAYYGERSSGSGRGAVSRVGPSHGEYIPYEARQEMHQEERSSGSTQRYTRRDDGPYVGQQKKRW